MNTKQLLIFKHFVEAQNENAVAEKLGITQPTVTFHLKNLSKECGLPYISKKVNISTSLKPVNYFIGMRIKCLI
ncbi:LysR family transcriptional regulator [Staphylococcus haemolyticus]